MKTAHLPLFREHDDSFPPSDSSQIDDPNLSEDLPFPNSVVSESNSSVFDPDAVHLTFDDGSMTPSTGNDQVPRRTRLGRIIRPPDKLNL